MILIQMRKTIVKSRKLSKFTKDSVKRDDKSETKKFKKEYNINKLTSSIYEKSICLTFQILRRNWLYRTFPQMLKSQKSFSFSSPYLQPVQKSHTNKTLSQMYRDTRSWVLLLWSFERGRMLMCVSCSMTLKNSPHQINRHILDKR